jgi:sugar/nucleoside kinase (ribokinase family)
VSAYDVVCVGQPFLDLTFVGLDRLPRPGEELFAEELALTPGGAAITAVGAARLGLRSALLWPRGGDLAGDYLQAALAAEGIDWIGPASPRAAATVVFPIDGDRAMATFQPADQPDDAALAAIDAGAVVVGMGRAAVAPAGAPVYAVGGHPESERYNAGTLRLEGCRALLVNEEEARRLTGAEDPELAAVALATTGAEAVVVTLGRRGAVEWADGTLVHAPAPEVDIVDTTGAGDLFTAAYVFADLAGAPRAERLAHAGLYAGLSVRTATGVGGALTLRELEEEARLRGLPAVQRPVAMEEKR